MRPPAITRPSHFFVGCLLSLLAGCSGNSSSSPPVVPPAPPITVPAAKPKFVYTGNQGFLVSYAVSAGAFTQVGTTYSGVYGLQIAVDPSSSFVYVPQGCSNCTSGLYNVVHQYSIAKSGALTPLAPPTVPAGVTPYAITVTS